MGLPSLLVGQPNTSPKKNDEGFYPIQLSSSPILGGAGGSGSASGVIFSGSSVSTDDPSACCGRYSFLNTDHQGIAGLTSDGCLLFVVNSRIGGQRCSIIGAFNAKGDPVTPTKQQVTTAFKFTSNDSKPIILDAKSSGALGLKAAGADARGGVYVGNRQFIYDLGVTLPLGGKTTLDADASATTDWDGKLQSRGLNLKLANGGNSLGGSLQQNGKQLVRQVNATAGDWTVSGKYTTNPGSSSTREVEIGRKINDQMRVSIAWTPDNKPPKTAPRLTPYEISHPSPAPDYSQIGIKIEIKFH